ncbi:hypothetical protein Q5H91_04000 [Sphingomonas sp. KR1UV-12]|uniref:Uncharacterized protein n=1 Tax=Sphingomonas aurea TaxID=3063994 RepID=A0ABT9EHC9_9SPHN|nr:hypothetical protein [Sphingomonas sp. KR1UV-12]MDP1026364.1 hypothetical protein [Sphingomonas sp. KR1UV-12]
MIPRLATYYDRDYCAAGAVHLLREREAKYPALIAAGKLPAETGALGQDRARALVAQWCWAMDLHGPIYPPWDEGRGVHGFGAYEFELAEEMTAAAARGRAIADRDPTSWAKREIADLCDALAWWQSRDPGTYSCRIVRETVAARRCAAAATASERDRKAA